MKNKDKIRIVLFSDTICDANGVSRFLQDMAKEALKKETVEFHIFSSTVKTYCDELPNVHIFKPALKMKMPFYKELDLVIPPAFKMAKKLKQLNPDVVHISTPGFVGIAGLIIALRYKKPIVGTYHTDFPMYLYKNTNSKILKSTTSFFMRLFYWKFEALATRSQEYIQNIQDDIKFKKENIYFLQPGTNISSFDPKYSNRAIWERYKVNPEYTKFLYVGRATKEKNLDLLFEYWKEFYRASGSRRSHLIIVGSGELEKHKDELKSYNVVFLGHKQKEELSTLYASSDIFLFPSTTDTLGQVVLESMASGTPVVVTDEGGPCGIVSRSEKEVGYIISATDKQRWIELLTQVENEQIDTNLLGKNANIYAQNFSIEKTFDSFIDIHRRIF
jgi:glycosyltransferase involved in cell wall biosynthesis